MEEQADGSIPAATIRAVVLDAGIFHRYLYPGHVAGKSSSVLVATVVRLPFPPFAEVRIADRLGFL